MKDYLPWLKKNFILLLLSLLFAFATWIVAVTTSDPTQDTRLTTSVSVELRGLGEDVIMTNSLPESVSVNVRAPASVLQRINNERVGARAIVDVSGLNQGEYEIPIEIEIEVSPIQITSFSPLMAKVTLDEYGEMELTVSVSEIGDVPTAFRADAPIVTPKSVKLSGSKKLLTQVSGVRVVLDRSNMTGAIDRELSVSAIDASGQVIRGLTISPDRVKVHQDINLRGGYKVMAAKIVTTGQVPEGFLVTRIGVEPVYVTIYSSDRALLDSLPGYMETLPLDLSEINDDFSEKIGMKIPSGVTLVGEQSVTVKVEVQPVEGSITLTDVPVFGIGAEEWQTVSLSPEMVDVYLNGPLNVLNEISVDDVMVMLELQDLQPGTYQIVPDINVTTADEAVKVQSIVPETIDVIISGESPLATATQAESAPTFVVPVETLTPTTSATLQRPAQTQEATHQVTTPAEKK